ncbi:hypothetical protein [Pseudotabrizicola sp. 4114]|uniref:hypothetical protein n=1 Tax=Pseudotabrizicola sp. 4114 TaxID=2817731 RepID=UPI0032B6F986
MALAGLTRADHPLERLFVTRNQRSAAQRQYAQALALRLEHLLAQAPAVKEAHCQPLGQGGAKHLHQVINGSIAARLRLMQDAKARVQPCTDQRRTDVTGQKRGQVIDRSVERAAGRAFAVKVPLVRGAKAAKRGPVDRGRPPLVTAQHIKAGHGAGKAPDRAAKGGDGTVDLCLFAGAVEHRKPGALVALPRRDQHSGQRQPPFRVQHQRRLRQLQFRLCGLRRGEDALRLAVTIDKGKRGVGGQRVTPDRVVDHRAGAKLDTVHPRGRQR